MMRPGLEKQITEGFERINRENLSEDNGNVELERDEPELDNVGLNLLTKPHH